MDFAVNILNEMWQIMNEMSPYLLFGFAAAGVLSVVISRQFIETHLGGRGFMEIVKAAVLGVPMPLCSCSVIPVTVGLRRHGAGKGATASFLASTPQTGVDSIAVTYSLMGGVFTVFRVAVAFVCGLLCGTAVELFAGKNNEETAIGDSGCSCCGQGEGKQEGRLLRMLRYGFIELPRDIGRALLLGVFISALIGALLPPGFFSENVSPGLLSMLLALLIGIPVYVCSTASIPVALSMIRLGLSPGAALVFLIAGPATNAATLATIWKVLGRRTALVYLGVIVLCALGAGLLFDVMPLAPQVAEQCHAHDSGASFFSQACSVLLILLAAPGVFKRKHKDGNGHE